MVKQGINMAKNMIPKDGKSPIDMDKILDLVTEIISNLAVFFGAFAPESD